MTESGAPAGVCFLDLDAPPGYRAGVVSRRVSPPRDTPLLRLLASPQVAAVPEQVHGAEVARVETVPEPGSVQLVAGVDGLVTTLSGLRLAARGADCPVLVGWDGASGAVGVLHAGWRGAAAGAAHRWVDALVACGARADRLHVRCAPSIGPCCYEVGREVAERFLPEVRERRGDREFLDLRAALLRDLADAGVFQQHASFASDCTRCSPIGFPSYRRDGVGCGRLLAWVCRDEVP